MVLSHVATISAAVRPWRPVPAGARREVLTLPLPDDEALRAVALWQDRPAPAVLLVHGVGGSSESAYVVRAARAFFRQGFHAVSLTLRGSGLGAGLARRFYHAGLVEDVTTAVAWLGGRPEVTSLGLVGYSLGGHVVLLTAAGWGAAAPAAVRAVVTVSAPFDLAPGCRRFEQWPAWPYARNVVRGCVAKARALKARLPDAIGIGDAEIARVTTLWDFDDRITAPMHGFASAAHYYAAVSCGPHLPDVRVPTLALHAADDPMVGWDLVEPWVARAPPAVRFAVSPRGGHVGFVDGVSALWAGTWAQRQAAPFLAEHLGLEA